MGQEQVHETPRQRLERVQREAYNFVFSACKRPRDWMPPKPKRSWTAHELVLAFMNAPAFQSLDDSYEFTEEIYRAAFRLIDPQRSGKGHQDEFRRSTPIRYLLSEKPFGGGSYVRAGNDRSSLRRRLRRINYREDLWYRSVVSTFLEWRTEVSSQYFDKRQEELQALLDRSSALNETLEGAVGPDESKRADLTRGALDLELDFEMELLSLMEVRIATDGDAWDAFADEQVDLLREWLRYRGLPYGRDDVAATSNTLIFTSMDGVARYKARGYWSLYVFDS